METVNIMMATYNGEKYLSEQLDSILSQSFQNFKIYISDDKSIDNTLEILLKYKKNYPDKIEIIDYEKKRVQLLRTLFISLKTLMRQITICFVIKTMYGIMIK